MVSNRLTALYPLAGVRIRAGDLEMRWIDDDLLLDLAELAGRGVHDDAVMPFTVPWTRGSAREVAQRVLAFQWAARPKATAERLVMELGVLVDGQPVGVQSASGDNWSVLREVETGSWLGLEHHGQGIGRRMRALMLYFCFEGLRAESVTSAAFTDNVASNAVSRRTGYEVDGHLRVVREGEPAIQNRYRMTRERWISVRESNLEIIGHDVEMVGVEAFLEDVG